MFKRVLVANRAEIALRIIRACKALGVETVAVHSEADAGSPHLKEADLSVCLGPAPSAESYLDQDAVLQAALQHDCQALHPGDGVLSENARFAERCLQQKTTFIGPRPASLRLMGDKVTARRTMAAQGILGVPGSADLVRTPEAALLEAEAVGYPILRKATAGGGGKVVRVCRSPEDLPDAFDRASMEALKAFGDGALYMERFVEGGRHIEFQILADRYGKVLHLGERECSTQRSNQKLVEESPSPGLTPELRHALGQRLCAALAKIGYLGAGTVEFLRTPSGELFFMEMNTRLQVEHPVTELVTGLDLVQWQLKIAAGQPIPFEQRDITLKGHALECSVNAEDPRLNFRPSPGLIERFDFDPQWRYAIHGPVRVDTHVEAGYKIPTWYDSMIAKIIVHAEDRPAALAAMRRTLDAVAIEGVPTTQALLRAIMDDPTFTSGDYDTPRMAQMMARFATEE